MTPISIEVDWEGERGSAVDLGACSHPHPVLSWVFFLSLLATPEVEWHLSRVLVPSTQSSSPFAERNLIKRICMVWLVEGSAAIEANDDHSCSR